MLSYFIRPGEVLKDFSADKGKKEETAWNRLVGYVANAIHEQIFVRLQ